MKLTPGSRLGPYEVLAPVGAGGMGEVYRARDSRLGRDVALKIVSSGGENQADRFRRFEQEAKAVAALNHPHVLAVYDVGSDNGVAYVVFELLEGQTLRERIEHGAIPARKALEYGVQIGRGLAAAHARGIVHRDLKPENVFVTRDGQIKILDFGLAKLKGAPDPDLAEAVTRTATDAGIAVGTAGYMSPEQARGRPADTRSDVFALGAILYEILSGRPAFGGETRTDRLAAVLHHDPPELASAAREPVSPGLERVVRRCLEKDPEERFQAARDVAFALEALGSSSARDAIVDSRPPPRRSWRRTAAALVLAGAAAAAVVFAGRALFERPLPSFRQLTFRRGSITAARFAPDERTVVYSAAWDGKASEVFMTRLDGPESRSLGLPAAKLLSVSSRGELALLLTETGDVGYPTLGTLARVALAGGVPRRVLEDVEDADWSPDGQELVVIRRVNGQRQLEFPLGKVFWRPIPGEDQRGLRVSPRGDKVAVLTGELTIVDRAGARQSMAISGAQGLAWAPTGDALWVRMGETSGSRSLWRCGLDGSRREIYRLPGESILHDVAKSGAVLLHHGFERWGVRVKPRGETAERELAVLSSTAFATSVSSDGSQVVVFEMSRDGIYLYSVGGGEPVILARGYGGRLSADGKWVLTPPHGPDNVARLVPTGPGEPRYLPLGKLRETGGDFLDAGHIYWGAREPDGPERGYVQDIATGAIRPVTPEGVAPLWSQLVDGAVLGRRPDGTVVWCPVAGGEPRPTVVKVPSGEWSLKTTRDGTWMFVGSNAVPHRIDRISLRTGRRELWKVLGPPDLAGVIHMPWFFPMTPDGEAYAYTYLRVFQDLYLVEGLR